MALEDSMIEFNNIPGLSSDSVEAGQDALWTVSSCKVGCGVRSLRDGDPDTIWQSDGPQPHTVTVYFRERKFVECLCIFVNYEEDETYTPSRVCVKVGCMPTDLEAVAIRDLEQPRGWVTIPLNEDGELHHVFIVELSILANHQNGRDTHIRQCKVFVKPKTPLPRIRKDTRPRYSTTLCQSFATIR